jgi:regulator of nucleoside diphosphate kinase
MDPRNIIISAPDHAELWAAIASAGNMSERARAELKALESELDRARVVAPEAVPADVITMNSRAELLDLDTGERMEFTLVFPSEANIDEGKISVLAPLAPRCSATELAMSSNGPCPTACGG